MVDVSNDDEFRASTVYNGIPDSPLYHRISDGSSSTTCTVDVATSPSEVLLLPV